MPRTVEIPDVGVVEFPDEMTDDDVASAIERDILPSTAPSGNPSGLTPRQTVESLDTLWKAPEAIQEGRRREMLPAINVPGWAGSALLRGSLPAGAALPEEVTTAAGGTLAETASGLTSQNAIETLPWLVNPITGPAAMIKMGTEAAAAGAGEASVGLQTGDPAQVTRGVVNTGLGATMVVPGAAAIRGRPTVPVLQRSVEALREGVAKTEPVSPVAETVRPAEAVVSPDARLDAAVRAITDATEAGRPVEPALLAEYEAAKAAIAPKPVNLTEPPKGAFEEIAGTDQVLGRWWRIKEGEFKSTDGGTYKPGDNVSEGQMRMLGFEPPPRETSMGGAIYGELEPKPTNPTAAANRIVNEDRVARGQEELVSAMRKDDPGQVAEAEALLERDPELPNRLAAELASNARPISDVEGHVMTLRRQELRRSQARVLDEIDTARRDGRLDDLPRLEEILNDYEKKLTTMEAGLRAAGSELGRGLRARRVLINEDFSVEGMLFRARTAKAGKPLDAAEIGRIEALSKELTKVRTELDAALAQVDAQNAVKGVDAAIRGFRKVAPRTPNPATQAEALQAARVALAERVKAFQAGEVEGLGNIAQRLARLFVEQNLKITRDELVSKVHAEIAALDPTFTVRDTADAISGYGKFTPLNKGAVETVLRDLKGQLQQVSKLEDMAAGRAPAKTGQERRVPTAEERALIKQVEEAKRKGGFEATDPETQLKSALDAVKTRLRNQIEDLNRQIVTRTQVVRERTGVEYDAEAVGLREWRDALKEVYDQTFTTPEMAEAARMNAYRASIERRIAEYERRIRERDFAPKARREPPTTPEAVELRRKLAEAQQKWAIELSNHKLDAMTKSRRIFEIVLNATRGERKWLSSLDISMLGRQGGPSFLTHPRVTARAVIPSLKAFASEKVAMQIEDGILTRPNYINGLYGKSGLRLVDSRGPITMREEVFAGQTWADTAPLIGRSVRASERAYNTFLNLARANWFDLQVAALSRTGTPTVAEAAAVANLINKFTGYGGIKGSTATYGIMSDALWSPRFLLSRFQTLAHTPLMGEMTPRVRRALAVEYIRLWAGVASAFGMLTLFNKINWNPLSSDFGKLRDGETRIDLLMGLSQVLVFMSRALSGKRMTAKGDIKDIRGPDADYAAGDVGDVMFDFAVSKTAPVVSTVVSAFKGEYPGGDEFNFENVGKQLAVPLGFQEMIPLWEAHGLPKATFYNMLGLSGAGVQVHTNRPRAASAARRRPPLLPP